MARATSATQQRQLTLTEELEKLEQSITLTLQEIDHNFSRAHRIVTSSILPIVEQYSTQSKEVWEGSKFWKQFFESSANVSLSGYEEQPAQREYVEETATEDSNATTHTTLETSQSYETPSAQHISTDSIQDLDLSNLTISPSHSTPRPTAKQKQQVASSADYPSPYEALRQEVNNTTVDPTGFSQYNAQETPGLQTTRVDDVAMTPQSSPFLPSQPTPNIRPSTVRKKTDPLLHRVLDRNYRVQATPLTSNRHTTTTKFPPATTTAPPSAAQRKRIALFESTLSSSPPEVPPELHAEIFSSPIRKPRTPGISVLSPARHKPKQAAPTRTPGVWDSDEGDDEEFDSSFAFGGQSPPKTMQFHIPQSRLLRTPAQEASQRIIKDILQTAGLSESHPDDDLDLDLDPDLDLTNDLYTPPPQRRHFDENTDAYMGNEDDSPSVVRRAVNLEDETF